MILLLALLSYRWSQGTLPHGGKSVIRVPKLIEAPEHFLSTAKGFSIDLFADKLNQPRKIAIAPDGNVFVVLTRLERPIKNQPHAVVVLSGFDKAHRPTVRSTWTKDLDYPFGIQFGFGHLYIANTDSIIRWTYAPGQTAPSGKPELILDHIPAKGYRNHWTRNILFDSVFHSLFLTIGSVENLDREDSRRAGIERYQLDPTGRIVGPRESYASGMRNPIGLAIQPGTGRLWANVAERDYEGDDLVPDFLTSVRPHGFYGWPYAYIGNHHDPRMPHKPELERTTIVPDVLFLAHSTPIDVAFIPEGAVVTLHGSQNRSVLDGYKVVLIPFGANHKPSGPPQDLVTGWLPKWSNREIYGRPAGLAVMPDGSILIVDDWGGKIWRLRRTR
jgi:glucose/arabinose dehydrogenase